MLFKKLFACFATLLLTTSPILAQSPTSKESKQSQEQEKKKQDIEKRSLALIDYVIKSAQSLKLPENRIRIQANAANLLWTRDETRARALFKEATDGMRELLTNINIDGQQQSASNEIAYALRNEVIQIISQRDARLALDLLRTTRQPLRRNASYYGGQDPDAQMEVRLATQLVDKDPEEAVRIAVENLPKALDYGVITLLSNLQSKDKALAAKFATALMKHLRTEDLIRNNTAAIVAVTLLQRGLEAARVAQNLKNNESITELSPRLMLDEQSTRELCEMVTAFVLNVKSSGGLQPRNYMGHGGYSNNYAVDVLKQLQPLMGEMERLAPSKAAVLLKVWADYQKKEEAQNGPINRIHELVQSGTLEALMEAIPKAPPEMRDSFYQQAAWKAMNQGDMKRASEIADENISDENVRSQILLNLDRQQLAHKGDVVSIEEMRRLLPRLSSIEERVNVMVDFAGAAIRKKDKATALQLLDEAQSQIGQRASSYNQMYAQIQLAEAFRTIEPRRSIAIIEVMIGQVNELAPAAAVLNGFDIQYFKEGEMILYNGGGLSGIVQQCATHLGSLARQDFDSARQVIEQIQLNEARLMACLLFAQSALENDDYEQDAENADSNNPQSVTRNIITTYPTYRGRIVFN